MIAAVWPTANVSDASLAQCVSEVRLALGDEQQRLIRTVVGRGYRFDAAVTALADGGRVGSAAPSPPIEPRLCAPARMIAADQERPADTSRAMSGNASIVGRDDELEWMLRRWREAAGGDGQVVLLSGEAGIGKSRLILEFLAQAAAAPEQCLHYVCAAGRSDSPLHPAICEIETAARIASEDELHERIAKLEAFLQGLPIAPVDRSALTSLLRHANDGTDEHGWSPPERRQRVLDALLRRIEGQSLAAPAIVVVEDIHWIDPTSLELLDRLVDRTKHLRLLMVLTFRPDIAPPWIGQHHVSLLTLNRLSPHDISEMIASICERSAIAAEVVKTVIERSAGVPLFVEELTQAALDGGITLARDIPSSLQASLTVRLDRLGPALRIAQLAAIAGESFTARLIAAVADLAAAELEVLLAPLLASGLILPQRPRNEAAFAFRHALLRDAVAATIPADERRSLHLRIATAMLQQMPVRPSAAPEVIASHFAIGGEPHRALPWWRRAGEDAMRNASFEEALVHFGKAIAIADGGGPDSSAASLALTERLALQVAYGQTLLWARSTEQAIMAFARARELAARIDQVAVRFASYYGLWAGNMMNARLGEARAVGSDFVREADDAGTATEIGVAHRTLGTAFWFMGGFAQAHDHLRTAVDMYDPERDRGAQARFSVVPGPPAKVCLALASFVTGDAAQATRLAQEALGDADRAEHVPTQTYVLTHALMLDLIGGASGRDGLSRLLLRLCADHALPHLDYARVLDLATRFRRGDGADLQHPMRLAIDNLCRHGRRLGIPWFLAILAEMEMSAGDPMIAQSTIDRAVTEAMRSEERWYLSQIHHLQSRLLLSRGQRPEAEQAHANALAVAASQQAAAFSQRISLAADIPGLPDGRLV
ncbi:conserved hypothetical protein; putative ATPase [Bradyrhizobium sp. ORS 278]|nr:conserved hypothetical protein; putative ATPase [Bradyrhizobium sp. ORS 278]